MQQHLILIYFIHDEHICYDMAVDLSVHLRILINDIENDLQSLLKTLQAIASKCLAILLTDAVCVAEMMKYMLVCWYIISIKQAYGHLIFFKKKKKKRPKWSIIFLFDFFETDK